MTTRLWLDVPGKQNRENGTHPFPPDRVDPRRAVDISDDQSNCLKRRMLNQSFPYSAKYMLLNHFARF